MTFLLGTDDTQPNVDEADLIDLVSAELHRGERRLSLMGALASGQAPWLLMLAIYLDRARASESPENLDRVSDLIGAATSTRWLTAILHEGMLFDDEPMGRTLTPAGNRVVIDCVRA